MRLVQLEHRNTTTRRVAVVEHSILKFADQVSSIYELAQDALSEHASLVHLVADVAGGEFIDCNHIYLAVVLPI